VTRSLRACLLACVLTWPAAVVAGELPPNELGRVMILEYHKIDQPEERWTRTPDNFRRDLERLWERGYRLVALNDFLDRVPVTGLLIARDDTILTETYQYARTDRDRFDGHSMTKALISMLMGIAVGEHRIRSIGDSASTYVPALGKSPYGETPLRELLLMSSGVTLNEDAFWKDVFTSDEGTGKSLAKSGTRTSPIGTTFKYSSGDSEVLTTVLRHGYSSIQVGRGSWIHLEVCLVPADARSGVGGREVD